MKRDDIIDHEGVILDINPDYITVEILSSSACGSCAAKGACSLGEVEAKVVEVANSGYNQYEPGERVNVLLRKSLGHKALYISYLIPLLILVSILLSLSAAGAGDLITGLAIIGGLALYYSIVYLFRERFRKEYVFTIEKLN
jgi:sigma-E factor negative regulatory protein RseC